MNILWFTNSPCGSIRRFSGSVKAGGWMISLEDEIKNVQTLIYQLPLFLKQKKNHSNMME